MIKINAFLLSTISFCTFTMEDANLELLTRKFHNFRPPRNYSNKINEPITTIKEIRGVKLAPLIGQYKENKVASTTKRYTCTLCNKLKTTELKAYSRHLKSAHQILIFVCPNLRCQDRFENKRTMIAHRKTHEKWYCPSCPKGTDEFESYQQLRDHCKNFYHFFYECKFCTKKYKLLNDLSDHERLEHLEDLKQLINNTQLP